MSRSFFQTTRSFRQQRGTTLIEVIVSVFLLTFGVLGLMAAQIRSVASISEAESRSTVSQAAEMLAESMLSNPEVIKVGDYAVRRYTNYTSNHDIKTVDMSAENTLPTPLWGTDWSSSSAQSVDAISKKTLAQKQIEMFEYILRQTPNADSIQYVVCEESNYPPRQAELNASGTLQPNCSAAGSSNSSTVIKVVWTTRPAKEGEKPNAYSYLLQVQE